MSPTSPLMPRGFLRSLFEAEEWETFRRQHLYRQPYAAPARAAALEGTLSWSRLGEIFRRHNDCWLAETGRLLEAPRKTGRLTLDEARGGFEGGATVLIRHAEFSDALLRQLADEFYANFSAPIDIQLYVTPGGHEGFDWHYDLEDVFVFQTQGEKEFYLLSNTVSGRPLKPPQDFVDEFLRENKSRVIACRLHAGDWLYIPAGFWHKARAHTDSFHISVGVLARGEIDS